MADDELIILGNPSDYCPICAKSLGTCQCVERVDVPKVIRKIMAMSESIAYSQDKKLLRQAHELYTLVSKSIERR